MKIEITVCLKRSAVRVGLRDSFLMAHGREEIGQKKNSLTRTGEKGWCALSPGSYR